MKNIEVLSSHRIDIDYTLKPTFPKHLTRKQQNTPKTSEIKGFNAL